MVGGVYNDEKESLLHNYNWSVGYYGYRGLEDCYSNPSVHKWRAYRGCIDEELALGANNGTVVGYNCMAFTYAFKYIVENEGTGEITERMRYYTKDNTYDFEIA